MVRLLLGTLVASAIYGFSIGSAHSLTYASWNLVKFPLMIIITGSVCSVSYYVFSRFVSKELLFKDVQMMSLRAYHGISILLASLSPVSFFLARTLKQPDETSLNEYPFFLGLNVVLIAISGSVALSRQAWDLLQRHGLQLRRSILTVLLWLSLSLFVGGQCAWYLRPFFGISTIKADESPFILGTTPDFRGDTNFYAAVYHIVFPPPLEADYFRRGKPLS